MQTTKICIKNNENKITEYRNGSGTLSQEEIETAKYVRNILDQYQEEMRCQHIDDAVDRFADTSNKYIYVDRRKKLTLKDMIYDFICSFDLFDILALAVWGIVWLLWWWLI